MNTIFTNAMVSKMNDDEIYSKMIAPHGGSIKSAYGMRTKACIAVANGKGLEAYQHRFRGQGQGQPRQGQPQQGQPSDSAKIPVEFSAAILLVSNLKGIPANRGKFKEEIENENLEVVSLLKTMLGESGFKSFCDAVGVKSDSERMQELRNHVEQADIMAASLRNLGYRVEAPDWVAFMNEHSTFKEINRARTEEREKSKSLIPTTWHERMGLNPLPEHDEYFPVAQEVAQAQEVEVAQAQIEPEQAVTHPRKRK